MLYKKDLKTVGLIEKERQIKGVDRPYCEIKNCFKRAIVEIKFTNTRHSYWVCLRCLRYFQKHNRKNCEK